ncbi:MAG: type I-E CRISPR-associated endonuclease Cas1e [Polyangiaceae bacterium]
MSQRVVSDLSQLPRVADGWTFLYTEKVRIERADYAIELRDKTGRIAVPVAALSSLMLGPGSTITHAAVLALAEGGCSIVWCGEHGARFYASGLGETRRSHHLEAQAIAWASKKKHAEVVRRMYTMRFPEGVPDGLSLEQIRGREGARVRDAYASMSRETGVPWNGRSYKQADWAAADPVNRAISAANASLYGLCHGAIVATGFSPGLGFVHVGKQLSFVYDIADLYKLDVTVPAAFRAARDGASSIESRVRKNCRDLFHSTRLLERIVPDLQRALGLSPDRARLVLHRGEEEADGIAGEAAEEGLGDAPGALWNSDGTTSAGGHNFAPSAVPATTGPSIAKTIPEAARGDAYEDDVEWPVAASDDEVPF